MVQLSSLIAQEESFPITSPELSKLKLPGSTSILKSDGSGFEEDHPGIQIQPTAGFVLKTKSGDSKVFINVCYCDNIEKPGIKHKLDDDGKEVEGWNVPLSMGPIRKCLDKANNTCSVVDAVIHPSVQDDIHLDTSGSHRNFICQILMQCFDQKYKELSPLDRKYSLPNTKYIGYVNVKTGEIARKMGKDVEICKQYIKDTSSRPKIVEEMSRSQIKDDAAISLNTASETSSMSPATTTYNTSSSGNKIDATTITTTTPTPLLLSIDVYLQILYDEGIEKLLSVQEFLDALQNVQQRYHHDHDHDQHHQHCLAEERSIQAVLPTKKWDSSSRLPLILDSYDFEQYFKVSHVVVQASTSCNFCSESIEIYVSAFCLKVMTKSHGKTSTTTECIQECILPFSVNTQQVKCTYNPNTNVLSTSMQISSTSICQKADIGSQPWLIANALSLKTTNKRSRRNTTSDNNRNDNRNEEGDNHKTEKVFDDDPFHLQSPFPWKQSSHNSSTMTANNEKNMTNKNKITTDSATMTCILPEDRFHQNDCMSQYLIEKQQQQQKQRLQTTTKAKEKVFMEQPDNREKQPASSKNLLLKNENDCEYYMDCFKKNKDSSRNSTSGTKSSNDGVLLDDASFQRHHMNCIKQAEDMLLKKIHCPPSASVTEQDDISNTSPIYENWWYKMMY